MSAEKDEDEIKFNLIPVQIVHETYYILIFKCTFTVNKIPHLPDQKRFNGNHGNVMCVRGKYPNHTLKLCGEYVGRGSYAPV